MAQQGQEINATQAQETTEDQETQEVATQEVATQAQETTEDQETQEATNTQEATEDQETQEVATQEVATQAQEATENQETQEVATQAQVDTDAQESKSNGKRKKKPMLIACKAFQYIGDEPFRFKDTLGYTHILEPKAVFIVPCGSLSRHFKAKKTIFKEL